MRLAIFFGLLLSITACTTPAEEIHKQEAALISTPKDVDPVDSTDLSDQKPLQDMETLDFIVPPTAPCQHLLPSMEPDKNHFVSNSVTFALGTSLEAEKFSSSARKFIPAQLKSKQLTPEAYRSLLSYDFLHFCESSNLVQINPKSQVKRSSLAAPESWDYIVAQDDLKIGVRVIAFHQDVLSQIGDEAIAQVLAISVESMQKAVANLEPGQQWTQNLLFVWNDFDAETQERLQKIWEGLGATSKGTAVLYSLSAKGAGFMLCEPQTHTGEECKR